MFKTIKCKNGFTVILYYFFKFIHSWNRFSKILKLLICRSFLQIIVITMTELLLDPAIRTWVFLPVIIITFLVGVLRHYVSLFFTSKKKLELQQVQDRFVCLFLFIFAILRFILLSLVWVVSIEFFTYIPLIIKKKNHLTRERLNREE